MKPLFRCLCLLPLLFLINAKVITIHKNDGTSNEKYLPYDMRKITFTAGTNIGKHNVAVSARALADNVTINHKATLITLTLTENAFVAMDLYDAKGRRIASLARAPYAAGISAIAFPNRSLGRGVYIVHARYNGKVMNKRFAVVR